MLEAKIPEFELEKSRKSNEEEEEKSRKISDVSVFTHNNKTGTLEVHLDDPERKLPPRKSSSPELALEKANTLGFVSRRNRNFPN
mmetsp:Transcript_21748/g.21471  ORF Transcript_21748/g.21471 Transcript_21748/m.21471 type:complete len:85 (-) Transcript_21748:2627-2881(-)